MYRRIVCLFETSIPQDPGLSANTSEQIAYGANREVRHTIIRTISAHFNGLRPISWQGCDLDFTGVVFDGGDFSTMTLPTGLIDFKNAVFLSGLMDFSDITVAGALLDFEHARFSGGRVDFSRATFVHRTGSGADFAGADFSGSEVDFSYAKLVPSPAEPESSEVFLPIGSLGFSNATFSGGKVDFGNVEFRAITDFTGVKFTGGEVDFSDSDWSSPPLFDWTDEPPPGLKLPGALLPGDQTQETT